MEPTSTLPSVTIALHGTAAALLVKLMTDRGISDPLPVLSAALGMMEQAVVAQRQGHRLGVYDPATGRFIDLVL